MHAYRPVFSEPFFWRKEGRNAPRQLKLVKACGKERVRYRSSGLQDGTGRGIFWPTFLTAQPKGGCFLAPIRMQLPPCMYGWCLGEVKWPGAGMQRSKAAGASDSDGGSLQV